jgi:membrane-bound metal-dependent hydrolase YbcI (DUF457 family)
MFIGHFGLALATKPSAPKISLPYLILAAQFVDLLWPLFLLLGFESVRILPDRQGMSVFDFTYPYSHSLLAVLLWSFVLGLVYWYKFKSVRAGWIGGLLVSSHWVLDLLVHEPDLPLSPWSDIKLGLGLWHSPSVEVPFEIFIFCGGAYAYWIFLSEKKKFKTQWSLLNFAAFISILLVIYLMSAFGPTPAPTTTSTQVAIPGVLMWIFVWWCSTFERKV